MAEVVEALEGSIAPIECISQAADGSIVCSRESGRAESGQAGSGRAGSGRAGSRSNVCPTKLLWTRVRSSIVNTLRETTLADLLSGPALAGGQSIPSGPTLPTLGVQPLTTAAQPSTLTTGA
jgi:DNA-binding IscR family transcriptional regulator